MMRTNLNTLVVGLLLGVGCTATDGDDGATDTSSSPSSSASTESGAESSAGDTTSPDSTADDGDSTTAGSGEGTGEGTGGTGADTSGTPPATCLNGKVGVFNVNTEILYEDDPDFVVHTYPSNSPDDSPASTEDFFSKVEADPSIDKNFLFASGFSYGATMSLVHGYMSSDRLAGIIHLSQYSNPSHWEDELYAAARRIPVYIIHDDGYDGGGQALRQFLLGKGYEDDVDLFYLDFEGGHSAPSPEEWKTVTAWMKTMSLNGPCDDGG